MWTILFVILLFAVFGKILGFAIRAAWGITKIAFTVVLLPIVLVCLVFMGLMSIALPVLLLVGLVSLIFCKA